MVVTSTHKPKSHEPAGRPDAEEARGGQALPVAAADAVEPAEKPEATTPVAAVNIPTKTKDAPAAPKVAPAPQERVPAAEPAGG
jgi:hypothetical protein